MVSFFSPFFKYIFIYIYSLQGKKLVCMCLAHLCKCSSHCWSCLSLLKRKRRKRGLQLQLTLKVSVHFFSKYFLILWPARPMSESSSLNVSQLSNTSLTSRAKVSKLAYLKGNTPLQAAATVQDCKPVKEEVEGKPESRMTALNTPKSMHETFTVLCKAGSPGQAWYHTPQS